MIEVQTWDFQEPEQPVETCECGHSKDRHHKPMVATIRWELDTMCRECGCEEYQEPRQPVCRWCGQHKGDHFKTGNLCRRSIGNHYEESQDPQGEG